MGISDWSSDVCSSALLICLGVDKVGNHHGWAQYIKDVSGKDVNFPMIGDYDLNVSKLYNMLPAEETEAEGRTAAANATVRTVYIIGPDQKIKAMLIYQIGRASCRERV